MFSRQSVERKTEVATIKKLVVRQEGQDAAPLTLRQIRGTSIIVSTTFFSGGSAIPDFWVVALTTIPLCPSQNPGVFSEDKLRFL